MTAVNDEPAAGTRFRRCALLVGLAAAITTWIFTRAGTPFAGYDWVELEGFNKHLYREALLSGHLPLWNPYVGFGRPFLADIDTATLYPLNLLFLLPATWALPLCVLAHTTLVLLGVGRLGRDLNLSWRASLLAGVTLALSTTLLARLQAGQIQVFCAFAWLPLWWAFAWRAWREPSWSAMVAFAITTAMVVLAGSPPLLWAMSWAVLAWLLAWSVGRSWRESVRGGMTVLAGGVVGLGLAAVQLLPFLELAGESNRPLHDPAFANLGALPVRNLASLFVPSTDALRFFWEMNLFTGVLAPLGLVAVVLGWNDRAVRTFAVVGLAGLLLSLEPLGLAGSLAAWLPGMAAFRLPCRYAIVVGWALVCIVLLVWQRRAGPRGTWIAALAGFAQVGSLLWAADLHARQYAVAAKPEAEDAVAARAVHLAREVAPAPLRVALARDAVRSNAGVLYGFSNLESFASPGLARVWNSVHALAGMPPRAGDPVRTADLAVQPREALEKWGVQFGWDGRARDFFFTPSAGSRAQAVFAAETSSGAAAAALRWWAAPAGTVFLERAVVSAPATNVGGSQRTLTISSYDAERIDVAWGLPKVGWLVLAEPWFPGWRARVAGEWVDVQPANGWMRAVTVPAGADTVRLEFRPRSLIFGACVSAGTVAALLVGWWWTRRNNPSPAARCRLAPS